MNDEKNEVIEEFTNVVSIDISETTNIKLKLMPFNNDEKQTFKINIHKNEDMSYIVDIWKVETKIIKPKIIINGFEHEHKFHYFGEGRYFKETERLFPNQSYLLTMTSGRFGYVGDGLEWFRGDEYILLTDTESKITTNIGLVRQSGETLDEFEKRYKKYVKEMKNSTTSK